MTRTDDFVQQLERYLDEYDGMTPLPVDVRDAVRAALPSTKQTRPTRGLMRYLNVKRPTAVSYGLVAVAVVAVVALGASALLNNQVVGPAPSASPLAGCTGISASGETLTVGWCPTRPDGQQVREAFSLTTTAAAWTNGEELVGQDFLFFRPGGYGMQPGGTVAVWVGGPTTVDAWLAQITGEARYSVSEPLPISLGGSDGYAFNVDVASGVNDAPPLFKNGTFSWEIDDRTTRIWLVDHDGQAVMFATKPSFAGVYSWTEEVGHILQTIEWVQDPPPPSASALADCTEGISASGETLTVGWCPTRPDGQQVRVPFRLTTTAAAWTNGNQFMFEDMIFFRPYGAGMQPGGSVGISVGGPATVDTWLAQITGEETYTVTEPQPISLGGAEGYVFDVSVAPGFTSFYAPPLFDNSARPWELSNDLIDRVWLVEHAGQSVMFVTTPVGPRDNPVSSDQSWAREIGDALQTIEWIP